MNETVFLSDFFDSHFFHVCTDGTRNNVIYTCDEDFEQANIISALCSWKCNVNILCMCHMSTHSHFLVECDDISQARKFINSFKHNYGQYFRIKYNISSAYRDIDSTPTEICSLHRIRKCISYILLNPVKAKIVRYCEEYKWSSFHAYFNRNTLDSTSVGTLGERERRSRFKTRYKLDNAKFKIHADGSLDVNSVVDSKKVEFLYGTREQFYASLNTTDSISEEELYVHNTVRYNDMEIIAEAIHQADKRFHKASLSMLTKWEKKQIASTLKSKTGASPKRLARIFMVSVSEMEGLFKT